MGGCKHEHLYMKNYHNKPVLATVKQEAGYTKHITNVIMEVFKATTCIKPQLQLQVEQFDLALLIMVRSGNRKQSTFLSLQINNI